MGVQQHRRSKAKNRTRRAEILKLTAPNLQECPKCHELKQPHRMCPNCGYYKGREIIAEKTTK